MENTQETKTSAAKQIAIIVLLGAIGSGVWSLVGEPLIQSVGSGSVRLISWFSAAYLDAIYSEIGKGLYERNASLLHSSFTGFYVAFWMIAPFAIFSRWQNLIRKVSSLEKKLLAIENGAALPEPDEDETPEQVLADSKRFARKLKSFFWLLASIAPIVVAFELGNLYRTTYSTSAVIYLERSIEILAPHLGATDYVKLRASYRTIEKRDQFVALHEQLISTAKAKNVEIPQFSPL